MRFSSALDLVEETDNRSLLLPRFQRSFVWKKPDIKEFIDSVYREYPVGALATWESSLGLDSQGNSENAPGRAAYLLDGQQRLTSIYGVIRGRLPGFNTGGENLTEGLLFHVKDRKFAYQGTKEVRDKPDGLWVNVTRLFRDGGLEEERERIQTDAQLGMDDVITYSREMDRLVDRLNKAQFPVLELNDANLTIEDVVRIFNKMNKGGKKLTPYELTFSVLSARWPSVRQDFQEVVDRWGTRIDGDIDWLLRVVNAVMIKSGRLNIEGESIADVKKLLGETAKAIDHLLNLLSDRLGLDRPRVLKQRLPFAVMASFVVGQEGRIQDPLQRDRLLYWYVLSSVFGTYLRAPESRLTRDLIAVAGKGLDGIDALIEALRQDRPDLRVVPGDFDGTYSSSGFYTVLYMLTRVYGAKDWQTGETIRHGMLGQSSQPEMHHIFPRNLLQRAGVSAKRINNLGNIAFQTSFTNKSFSNQAPADYLPQIAASSPENLESQWMPMERSHWQVAEYETFLTLRRQHLADAANEFLAVLYGGTLKEETEGFSDDSGLVPQSVVVSDPWDIDQSALIEAFNSYAPGVANHPIRLPDGHVVYLDVAWPEGLQFGISQPAAYLFDPDDEVLYAANQAGFLVFTDRNQLSYYVSAIEGDVEVELD